MEKEKENKEAKKKKRQMRVRIVFVSFLNSDHPLKEAGGGGGKGREGVCGTIDTNVYISMLRPTSLLKSPFL